jgi:hypothetical protein
MLQLLSGARLTVFWAKVDAGSHIARHAHANEQITWLLEAARWTFESKTNLRGLCGPSSVLLIPRRTSHEGWYREKCRIVEFGQPRVNLCPAAANPYAVS